MPFLQLRQRRAQMAARPEQMLDHPDIEVAIKHSDRVNIMDQSTCRLLALPAELRNQICTIALVKAGPITITDDGYDRPGLLSCCRILRDQNLATYYSENRFAFDVLDFNNKVLRTFRERLPPPIKHVCAFKFTYRMASATPNWLNLLAWLQDSHQNQISHVQAHVQDPTLAGPEMLAMLGLFNQIAELREVPWSVVQKVVEAQRPLLINLDPRWE